MLVSLLVAPFGWIFDQSLALPAVLWGASRTSSQLLLSALALIYIVVEFQLVHFDLHSAAWLWTTPAWLTWVLFARASCRKPGMMPMPASPSPSVSSSS